ncbi:two-component system, chemotaxis family, response regulator CheY [Trichlorobacter thiogenes]|uniref:Two-component system, chemotaxis family, response regulator CheY n=1 Tax=Trichlorobacter thiogenes TaxID=115783 RepID=A0A1T4QZG8_9BACT|nr:response regulator [Trichlorobacter thiogenes]SKA08997.1 two-component system, chemotaxis family, response regulator CheY [Trichlorobacter thiogenes]
MRSLIVDDDDMGRLMLASFLEEFGPCDQAENGQQALELIDAAATAASPYNLICLDIIMPIMDGTTTLRGIRERDQQQGKRTKVFMISACSSPQDIEDAFFEGDCDDYVVKPFQREAVTQMLQRHKLI